MQAVSAYSPASAASSLKQYAGSLELALGEQVLGVIDVVGRDGHIHDVLLNRVETPV